ncbi:MAG: hypothetical protein LBJ71_01955, partial [Holosporaceae bacterium]|nr:hypothetical protein [Holosporaceae bacterium]
MLSRLLCRILPKKYRAKSGYVMILVAALMPVILIAVNYAVKRVQTSHKSTVRMSASYAVAHTILEKYNPGKTWTQQNAGVYSAAFQTLCDRAYELNQTMAATSYNEAVSFIARDFSDFSLAKMYYVLASKGKAGDFGFTGDGNKKMIGNGLYRTLLSDKVPADNVVFNPSDGKVSFNLYTKEDAPDKIAYNVIYYVNNEDSPNRKKLEILLDIENDYIKCDCKYMKKTIKVCPAVCNVDIVLTIPTNHAACTSNNSNTGDLVSPNGTASTPITEIANAYSKFLRENFSHTRGVAVGVVPYSAKVSIPPDRVGDWTVAIPPMNATPNPPYLKQIVAYGTEGRLGGDILNMDRDKNSIIDTLYDWGTEDGVDKGSDVDLKVGFPIMFRGGKVSTYRGASFYSGSSGGSTTGTQSLLLSTVNPTESLTGGTHKFLRMNPNPCYLGHCNLLAGCCEKNCPIYMGNPYFITELTDDVKNVIYDLSLIRPINDNRNKSNFLFLAVQWANNLLSDWTHHPECDATSGEKFAHPARNKKKKVVILIVNAPDNFEPQELTYLGFHNDNSEIPMMESDQIRFSEVQPIEDSNGNSAYFSAKGAIKLTKSSGSGKFAAKNDGYGCDVDGTMTARLTFCEKAMIRLVVKKGTIPPSKPTVTIYNDNGVSQNVKTHDVGEDGTQIWLCGAGYSTFGGSNETVLSFNGPTFPATNNTTVTSSGGANFGHNLSKWKIKYSVNYATIDSCTLSNQVLRNYVGRYCSSSKPLILNDGSTAQTIVGSALSLPVISNGGRSLSFPESDITANASTNITIPQYITDDKNSAITTSNDPKKGIYYIPTDKVLPSLADQYYPFQLYLDESVRDYTAAAEAAIPNAAASDGSEEPSEEETENMDAGNIMDKICPPPPSSADLSEEGLTEEVMEEIAEGVAEEATEPPPGDCTETTYSFDITTNAENYRLKTEADLTELAKYVDVDTGLPIGASSTPTQNAANSVFVNVVETVKTWTSCNPQSCAENTTACTPCSHCPATSGPTPIVGDSITYIKKDKLRDVISEKIYAAKVVDATDATSVRVTTVKNNVETRMKEIKSDVTDTEVTQVLGYIDARVEALTLTKKVNAYLNKIEEVVSNTSITTLNGANGFEWKIYALASNASYGENFWGATNPQFTFPWITTSTASDDPPGATEAEIDIIENLIFPPLSVSEDEEVLGTCEEVSYNFDINTIPHYLKEKADLTELAEYANVETGESLEKCETDNGLEKINVYKNVTKTTRVWSACNPNECSEDTNCTACDGCAEGANCTTQCNACEVCRSCAHCGSTPVQTDETTTYIDKDMLQQAILAKLNAGKPPVAPEEPENPVMESSYVIDDEIANDAVWAEYAKYRDDCLQISGGEFYKLGEGYITAKTPVICDAYGAKVPFTLYRNGTGTLNVSYSKQDSSVATYQMGANWHSQAISDASLSEDKVSLQFSNANINQFFIKNGVNKTFLGILSDNDDSILFNRGVGVQNKGSDSWIVFQGDGNLSVKFVRDMTPSFQFIAGTVAADHKFSKKQTIDKETEILIDPEEIMGERDNDNNYYIEFSIQGIEFVSAEFSNRKYSIEQTGAEYEGNKSRFKVAYVPSSFSFKVKPAKVSTLTITAGGLSDNVGGHNITPGGQKTLSWSEKSAAQTYKKFEYSTNENAKVTSIKVQNRKIRKYFGTAAGNSDKNSSGNPAVAHNGANLTEDGSILRVRDRDYLCVCKYQEVLTTESKTVGELIPDASRKIKDAINQCKQYSWWSWIFSRMRQQDLLVMSSIDSCINMLAQLDNIIDSNINAVRSIHNANLVANSKPNYSFSFYDGLETTISFIKFCNISVKSGMKARTDSLVNSVHKFYRNSWLSWFFWRRYEFREEAIDRLEEFYYWINGWKWYRFFWFNVPLYSGTEPHVYLLYLRSDHTGHSTSFKHAYVNFVLPEAATGTATFKENCDGYYTGRDSCGLTYGSGYGDMKCNGTLFLFDPPQVNRTCSITNGTTFNFVPCDYPNTNNMSPAYYPGSRNFYEMIFHYGSEFTLLNDPGGRDSGDCSFIGTGNIVLTAKSTLPVPKITLTKKDGTTETKNITEETIIKVTPETYQYVQDEQGGTNYYVNITLANDCVVVPNSIVNIPPPTQFIYYPHPDIVGDNINNVNIIDFALANSNNKPLAYGNITFGKDDNGGLDVDRHRYESLPPWPHYWVSEAKKIGSVTSSTNTFNVSGDTDGDFFMQIMDASVLLGASYIPAIELDFPNQDNDGKVGWGKGDYEKYTRKYAFAGLNRLFIPRSEIEDYESSVNFLITHEKAALVFGGFTIPSNYVLTQNGYQNVTAASGSSIANNLNKKPTDAVKAVTADACAKLGALGNTKIYVIKYKVSNNQLDSCNGNAKVYDVSSESQLNSTLKDIAVDIKNFSEYQ